MLLASGALKTRAISGKQHTRSHTHGGETSESTLLQLSMPASTRVSRAHTRIQDTHGSNKKEPRTRQEHAGHKYSKAHTSPRVAGTHTSATHVLGTRRRSANLSTTATHTATPTMKPSATHLERQIDR